MLVPAAWFISGRPHPKPGLAFNLSTAAVVIVAVAWGIRGHNALNVQRIVIQTDPAVRYKKTLNSSLASLKAKSAAIALLDAPAPSFLTGPFVAAPYNGTANVTGVLASTANLNVDQLAAQNRNLHPFVITGDGTAKLIVTSPSTFGLIGQPHCVVSKPDAKYTDGFNVPVLLPKPAAASFKPLVIAAALNTSNGTGRISMTATGRVLKWGVSFSDHALADHLRGVGAIAPAGSEAIVINASAGAAFCVTQVGVAPIIGYEAPR